MDQSKSKFLAHFQTELDSIETDLGNCIPSKHCLIPGCQSCSQKHRYVRANEISTELARLSLRGHSPYLVTITCPDWEYVLPSLHDALQVAHFCKRNNLTLKQFDSALPVDAVEAITKHACKAFDSILLKFYRDTLESVRLLNKYEYTGRVMPEVDFNYTSAGLKIKLHLHCVLGHRGKLSSAFRMKYTIPSTQRHTTLDPEDPKLIEYFCRQSFYSKEYRKRLSKSSVFDCDRIPLVFAINESLNKLSVHTEPIQSRKRDFERVGLYLTKLIIASDKEYVDGIPGDHNRLETTIHNPDLLPATYRELRQLTQLIGGRGILNSIALQKCPRKREEIVGLGYFDCLQNFRKVVPRTAYSKRSRSAFAKMRRNLKAYYDEYLGNPNIDVSKICATTSAILKSIEEPSEERLEHGDKIASGGESDSVQDNMVLTGPIHRSIEICSNIYGLHRVMEYALANGRNEESASIHRILQRFDTYFPTMLSASSLKRRFPLLSPGCNESNFFNSWYVLLTEIELTSSADRNRIFTYRAKSKLGH